MDIAIKWDPVNFRGDWTVNAGDLNIDPGGLTSAVLLSLFTDREAPADWVPPAGTTWDRRGWWGDTYEAEPIGSWLWLLNRSKIYNSKATLAQAANYAATSLAWLKNAGVVSSVTVEADWLKPGVMAIVPTLVTPNAAKQTFNFPWSWQGT